MRATSISIARRATVIVGVLGLLAAVMGLFPQMAHAAPFLWQVSATNNIGVVVTDFTALFTGTGGMITEPVVSMNAPGAGPAAIAAIGAGNEIRIDWGPPGLPMGGTFTFDFTTPFSPVLFDSGTWTVGGIPVAPVDPVRDAVMVSPVPEPSTFALLAIASLGLLGSRAGRSRIALHWPESGSPPRR